MKTTEALSALAVNEIIRQHPRTVGVFERHGIDACCGGAASVADAAVRHGADVDALLAELQRVIEAAA